MVNCFGIGGTQKKFEWMIEGFSSLLELPGKAYLSRPFKFEGYSWKLMIKPRNIDIKSGNECMGLYLLLEDASSLPSDLVLNIVCKFRVYDQLHNSHKIYTGYNSGEYYFRRQAGCWGFDNIISHVFLKYLAYGFLLNNTCNVSVKFLKFRANARKVDCSNIFERLSLEEKPNAPVFTWKIENLTKLPRPDATSMNFVAGGHKWNIGVYPDGKKSSDNLGIFLEMETTPASPLESELYVEYSLSLLDQINGQRKKFTTKNRFSKAAPRSGLIELLSLKDFQDPLKGFLVENACVIEASVMVIGSSTRP